MKEANKSVPLVYDFPLSHKFRLCKMRSFAKFKRTPAHRNTPVIDKRAASEHA